ncbi:MAG TPA: DUF3800 domain-containing protein [Microlunatus sp.]|nr:DUF3800 domain-containing protein [Microlunatus sp.]
MPLSAAPAAGGETPRRQRIPVEIACDESGFTGGNLTFPHTVFAHASVQVDRADAEAEMHRLRQRVAAHGELKASWLLRWCSPEDLTRLLGLGALLDGALIHLTDTRLFLLARLCDALLGPGPARGIDLPGCDPEARALALVLHGSGESFFGSQRWQEFLVAGGNVLRINSRWIPATAVEDFEDVVAAMAAAAAPTALRTALRRLRQAAGRAAEVRRSLQDDPRGSPLLEPLLPSLARAVEFWGGRYPALAIVHDEQSALTRWRIAEIAARLADRRPGHTLELVRVDSRDDARVQIADLVAGIARRAAAGLLTGRPDRQLLDLVRPLVDPRSVWADDSWNGSLEPAHEPDRLVDDTGR